MVGSVDERGRYLVDVTDNALKMGISVCGPGVAFKEIGDAIENYVNDVGLKVIPDFIGHGIGRFFHGAPQICHYRNKYPGNMLAGMTFTIEPIVCLGSPRIKILEDDWTAVTKDNSRSAQFEHTILITHDGVEVLTLPD